MPRIKIKVFCIKRGNVNARSLYFVLSPSFQIGFQAIAEALGLAAVKAVVAISAIIAGGRLVSIHISFLPTKAVMKILSDIHNYLTF